MRKKMLVMFATLGCLMVPGCLNVDAAGLWSTIGNLACESFVNNLPGSDQVDYCDIFSAGL